LDPDRSDTQFTQAGWVFTGIQVVLTGGAGIDMETIGVLARTVWRSAVRRRWPSRSSTAGQSAAAPILTACLATTMSFPLLD
jgi:hypothetical protein